MMIKLSNKAYVERLIDGYYYLIPGILANRVSSLNLDNFQEPIKSEIKKAIDDLHNLTARHNTVA